MADQTDPVALARPLAQTLALRPGRILCLYTLTDQLLGSELLGTYREIIPEDEKKKVDRFIFEKDRHTCLVTRALLRYALYACTGRAPEAFAFEQNDYGKPALVPDRAFPDIRFNLSHTSGMTACALSLGTDVGLDVEDTGRRVELSIAKRYFAPQEARFMETCPEADQKERFFEFWTLKESYIKARGMGLSIPLDQFAFDIETSPIHIWMDTALGDSPELWQFFRFSPGPPHTAALSVRKGMAPSFGLDIFECIPFYRIARRHDIRFFG